MLISSFVAAYLIRVHLDTRPLAQQVPGVEYLKIFVALMPFYLFVFAILGLYNKDIYERRFQEVGRVLTGTVIGMMGIISFSFAYSRPIFPARLVPVYAFIISFLLVMLGRGLLRMGRHMLFHYGIGVNHVLLIGSNRAMTEIAEYIGNTRQTGYWIAGYLGKKGTIPPKYHSAHYATVDDAVKVFGHIHTIIQTQMLDDSANQKIIDAARDYHVDYKFIPANVNLYTGNNEIELFHNFPVIAVHQTALAGWGRIAKRSFDIAGALIALILAIPVFLVVGLIIKLTDRRGPVFYQHQRVSRFGTMFTAYKLRSMYWRYSNTGRKSEIEIFKEMGREDLIKEWRANQKVKNDPRIMPIGRFTRKTGIDELPQLWNVLKGDLSLIGPRPVTKSELERYEQASSIFLSIRPGITGLWQVSGRNETTYDERIALDLYYIQHWSFLLDMKIVYRTLLAMVTGKGQ